MKRVLPKTFHASENRHYMYFVYVKVSDYILFNILEIRISLEYENETDFGAE